MAIKRIRRLKPQRLTKPNVLSFIAYTLILFFGTTILVNINPNANENYRQDWESRTSQPMQWIFLADNGKQYDLFSASEAGEHASAEDWSYLFPEEKTQTWTTIALPSDNDTPAMNSDFWSWNTENSTGTVLKAPKKAYSALRSSLEDRSVFITMVFEYLLRGDIVELPEGAVRYVVLLYGMEDQVKEKIFEEKSCLTPWGYEIDHGASVLAYEQRADAPHICNLQRRTCKNGKLSGSFTQSSCDESLNGNIKNLPYHTYNTQDLGEFIQPSKNPINENADFNLEGKINDPQSPILIAWTPNDETSDEANEVPQQQNPRKYCQAPRGEKVQAGQFVKAYRFKNGFTDIPCKVQLRLCVDGELEGSYDEATCQPWETSYEDFLHGYMNSEEPSPQRLLKMLKTEFEPDPEYGNNLSPELIDQLLNILRE